MSSNQNKPYRDEESQQQQRQLINEHFQGSSMMGEQTVSSLRSNAASTLSPEEILSLCSVVRQPSELRAAGPGELHASTTSLVQSYLSHVTNGYTQSLFSDPAFQQRNRSLLTSAGVASNPPLFHPDLRIAYQNDYLQRHSSELLTGSIAGLSGVLLPPAALNSAAHQGNSENFAFNELRVALQSIPLEEKIDYLDALRNVPDLVSKESDPARFLRFHGYNVRAAAQGLVRYWKKRREIFGERAFLPMTITGNGAMSPEDIQLVQSGVFMMLPNDAFGRTVVGWNPSRRTTEAAQPRLRLNFYVGQIISENPLSQTEGYILLFVAERPMFDPVTNQSKNVFLQTFPSKVAAFHLFDMMENKEFFRQRFAPGLAVAISNSVDQRQIFIYSGDRPQDYCFELMSRHSYLTRNGLPTVVGGMWTYERDLNNWQADRVQLELDRYAFLKSPVAAVAAARVAEPDPSENRSMPPSHAKHCLSDVSDDADGEDSKPRAAKRAKISKNVTDDVWEQPGACLVEDELEKLPSEETAAVREALRTASKQVWLEESNPELFLRVVPSRNPFLAARRLAAYWQLRSETFKSKQFYPITQSGEDALGRKDMTTLGTGFAVPLPNDSTGHSVLCVDCSKLKDGTEENCNRILFYMFAILAENQTTQNDGAVLLYKLDSPSNCPLDSNFLQKLVDTVPVRIKTIHLISKSQQAADAFRKKMRIAEQVVVHVGITKLALAEKLKPYGLTRAGLPRFLSGTWGYEKFVHWQELRTRVEWNIPLGLSGRAERDEALGYPAIKSYTILPESQKEERKRRLNVIHSRRKRDRERIELAVLEEQYADLKEEQGRLMEEGDHLQDLLRQASLYL